MSQKEFKDNQQSYHFDDKAGFADRDLTTAICGTEFRTPEQINEDTRWIAEVTQAIIQRRKDKQKILCPDSPEKSSRNN